jgi:thymidine kinase
VVGGALVREGATVVVADTGPAEPGGADGDGLLPDGDPETAVRYQVLCRRHHARGQLGPTPTGPGQLALP